MTGLFKSILVGFLVSVGLMGCVKTASDINTEPDQLILFSCKPYEEKPLSSDDTPESENGDEKKDDGKEATETFHEFPVLGKIELKDASDRKKIMSAFKDAVRKGEPVKCFWPRHGIRVVSKGKTVDYLICFHCCQFRAFPSSTTNTLPISRDPKMLINKYLTDAGIRLATEDE